MRQPDFRIPKRRTATARRFTLWRGLAMAIAPLLFGGCENPFAPGDGPPPPPNRLVAVTAGCSACVPSEATHPCPPSRIGIICSGVPPARAGDTLVLCAQGAASQGQHGRLEWRSSEPEVASVTESSLTVTHCTNEIGNAVLQTRRPGMTTIIVDERVGGVVVETASASVRVTE